MKILYYKRLQSTNTTAYHLGERGDSEWTVVTADIQTKGRGRAGKKWESPKGGLWFSILLRPDVSSQRVSMLQFLAANATRNAIENETGERVRLKWPNDLVLDGAKLGGILVELKIKGEQVEFAVIGIGINVNQPKGRLPSGASSLLVVSGHRYDGRKLLRAILKQLHATINDLDEPSRIMAEWWRWCVHRPMLVEVTSPTGIVMGITRGVDEDGALLVQTKDRGVERVTDGSLRLLDDFPT